MLLVPFLAFVQAFFVDECGQLPYRETVHKRNMELAHKRVEALLHQRTFHLVSAQRIGPVQHQHLDAGLSAGAHHQAQRGDEGVAADAHVLDIVHHNVHTFEHFRRRFTGAAIEGEHRQAGLGVLAAFHLVAGVDIAPHPMLRAIQGHQVHLGGFKQNVDGGTEVPVHPAGVGHQAHTLAS